MNEISEKARKTLLGLAGTIQMESTDYYHEAPSDVMDELLELGFVRRSTFGNNQQFTLNWQKVQPIVGDLLMLPKQHAGYEPRPSKYPMMATWRTKLDNNKWVTFYSDTNTWGVIRDDEYNAIGYTACKFSKTYADAELIAPYAIPVFHDPTSMMYLAGGVLDHIIADDQRAVDQKNDSEFKETWTIEWLEITLDTWAKSCSLNNWSMMNYHSEDGFQFSSALWSLREDFGYHSYKRESWIHPHPLRVIVQRAFSELKSIADELDYYS